MRVSLKLKIIFAFFSIVFLLIVSIGLTSDYFIEKRFEAYTLEKINDESHKIVNHITQSYQEEDRYWNLISLESIGVSAMENGYLIKVSDATDQLIWDATSYNKGFCSDILVKMEDNMQEQYPGFKGGYEEKSYVLLNGEKKFGSLTIGYYGPYFLSDNDLKYMKALKEHLIAVGCVSIILSLFLGLYISKILSRPLIKINENAQKIMHGNYRTSLDCQSTTLEICELSETINALSVALDNQEELRKRMTSDIAHELRTPITTLQSHLELIMEGIWQPDAERLNGLLKETSRLSNLVNDLSKIAQIEKEQLIIKMSEVDLYELAKQSVETLRSEFYIKNVSLRVKGDPSKMLGDAFKLNQVLINLLNNALKYTPEGGNVILEVTPQRDQIVLTVTDTGVGIPAEDLPFIFERFYRVDRSRARESGGAGIGLSIVKAIVAAHGGNIQVESKVNEGSRFIIKFPL